MEVVPLDTNYSKQLGQLNYQLIQDEGHTNRMSPAELEARMRGWLKEGYFCYGIVKNDQIVAYCLYRDDGDYYYIRQLFTARGHRKRGLASYLISYVETELLGSKPIRLEVLVGNDEAATFYKKRGYSVYCHTLVKDV